MERTLIAERRGPVGWITINRPEKRNAVTVEMWRDLVTQVRRFAEADVSALVITGAGGRAFASGADISEFGTTKSDPEAAYASFLAVDDACRELASLPIPVIAAIDGYAVGAGLELAVACDLRLGTQQARLGITSAKMGITIGQGHIRRLIAAVGPAWALDLLLTSRLVPAQEARQIGLLHRIVVDGDALAAEAQSLAELFVERAPQALAWSKRTIHAIMDGAPALAPAQDAAAAIQCFQTDDFREAAAAFREKRPPRFTGR